MVIDAVGPEVFAFEDIVRMIATNLGRSGRLIHVHPGTVLLMLKLISPFVGDVILTREEIEGLMANLLISKQSASGHTRFSDWVAANAGILGQRYSSEVKRCTTYKTLHPSFNHCFMHCFDAANVSVAGACCDPAEVHV